jgi:flagellar hook-associated protein 1 FlgK
MTIPSYSGLQTALSGLEAAQAAIDTTGQNIANANTPGYSRQTANLTERDPLTIQSLSGVTGGGSQLGLGVDVTNVSRIRDQFLDIQYRTQNTQTSGDNTTSTLLGQVQAALNEPNSSGLSGALTQFWQDWNALGNTPNDQGALQALIGSGQTVASGLNTLSNELTTLQSQVTDQYNSLTDPSSGPIASDANQIAALNTQIAKAQVNGLNPNTLLDQRDQLIDDLSQYSNVNVTTQANGMVNVSFGNAAKAAAGGVTDATPLVNGGTVDLTDNVTTANLSGSGGTLGALLKLNTFNPSTGTNSGQIANYLTTLDGVANSLVSSVNARIAGADAAGGTAPPFFTTTGTTAATINVNSALSGTTAPYTAAEAQAVGRLSNGSATQAYNAFVTQVGSDVQSTQSAQQTAQSLLTAISNQRQSVSGVSLDEEMTNLITYQQAYQASARVMNAINETLNTLINQVGAGI